MKENFRAWSINIDDFHKQPTEADKLRFLLNFAVLAPSSHNSQPWRFEVEENEIKIFLEPTRRLVDSDKNYRQAYISLGCAITNIVTAANYYGFSCSVECCLDQRDEYLAARITITKSSASVVLDKNQFIFSISKRVTNRNKYEDKTPPKSFMQEIKCFSADDLEICVITDQAQKGCLADIAIAAGITAMEDKKFRLELSQYVKSNITLLSVGMPAFGMGIPILVSFVAPTLIKYLNMNRLSRKSDEALLKRHTPVFVVIATREDNPINWIKTGQVYERIALFSTHEGLTTAMWAAPIQIGEYYREFQKILQTGFRPQAFFRLGYAGRETPHSPRLTSTNWM